MGMTSKVDIEKFNGTKDFGLWKMKMKAHLDNMRVAKALEGESQLPASMDLEKKMEVFERSYNTLVLSLIDKVPREVASVTTTIEIYIKWRFFKFKMVEGKDMHLNDYIKILLDLENIEEKYKDEDKASMLLNFLLKSYETFIDILEHGKEDVMSFFRSNDQKKKNEERNVSGDGLLSDKRGIIDYGCSFYMTPNVIWFETYEKTTVGEVLLGNNKSCRVMRIGIVRLKMHDGIERGEKDVLRVTKGSLMVMRGVREKSIYIFQGNNLVGDMMAVAEPRDVSPTSLWHKRLGHVSERGLKRLNKRVYFGKKKLDDLEFCENYIYNKATRVKFRRSVEVTQETLNYVHSDLWGQRGLQL
ncbi:uncharacterized protein LOC124924441 [Impatiens glandulifera]|uniref:uncharacterized protein LOC124924441 n=1 Tax=Impatiens glandulifera TaxID=253017 RepID=UPI001FB11FCE|nr:uncharacterized protein LOC124924441 [Impatiens glandulifera]